MKTLIIYKTKYGSTKQYAKWLSEELQDSKLINMNEAKDINFNDYENVIIGSRIYIGKIEGLKFIIDKWNNLKTKNVYLYTVGMTSSNSSESISTYETIPEYIRNTIKYIKLRGIIKKDRLSFIDKLIIKLMDSSEKDSKPLNLELNKNSLKPIITYFD